MFIHFASKSDDVLGVEATETFETLEPTPKNRTYCNLKEGLKCTKRSRFCYVIANDEPFLQITPAIRIRFLKAFVILLLSKSILPLLFAAKFRQRALRSLFLTLYASPFYCFTTISILQRPLIF